MPSHNRVVAVRDLLKRLYRYAFFICIGVASVLALVLFINDDKTPLSTKLSAVAAGLAASVIYTLIFALVANRVQLDLMQEEIKSEFKKHSDQILDRITILTRDHLPVDQYPGTPGFDTRFNADLMHALSETREYLFRGVSGKYIPPRLQVCNHRLERIRVIMEDPSNTQPDKLRRRALDRLRNPKYQGLTEVQISANLRVEVIRSLVSLFDSRHHCQIQIALIPTDPSVTRLEIFDTSLFLSVYRSPNAQGFPESLKYSAASMITSIFRAECVRQFEDSPKCLTFTANDKDDDLIRMLADVGISTLTSSELANYRQQAVQFNKKFAQELRNSKINT